MLASLQHAEIARDPARFGGIQRSGFKDGRSVLHHIPARLGKGPKTLSWSEMSRPGQAADGGFERCRNGMPGGAKMAHVVDSVAPEVGFGQEHAPPFPDQRVQLLSQRSLVPAPEDMEDAADEDVRLPVHSGGGQGRGDGS